MAAKERTCFCCGTQYKYCNQCKDYNPEETWRFLVHDKNCLDVYNIWQQYRGKEIDKYTAAKALQVLDLTAILKSNSPVVPVIKEILEDVEPKKKEVAKPVARKSEEKKEKTESSKGENKSEDKK